MKMELIQPFINAADAVLAQSLHCSTKIGTFSMDEDAYRSKGVAASIAVNGDIEGRIIAMGPPEAIAADARVIEAYLGHGAAARMRASAANG